MAAAPFYPYGDTVNTVLNLARSRTPLSVWPPDSFPGESSPGGQFTETGGGAGLATQQNPDGSLILRSQIIFNGGWRKFQKDLGNMGYRLLVGDNLVITELPANSNVDPSAPSWLSWNGFFDGTTLDDTKVLPANFAAPLEVRERISGQNAIFQPMKCPLDGLRPGLIRTILNRIWEWRENALYIPGATGMTDLQLRYIKMLPDFPDPDYPGVAPTVWYEQRLPIPDCRSPLAWYIAHEALLGKDAAAAQVALQSGMLEMNEIYNNQSRADSRVNVRRKPRAGARGSSWWY